MTVPASARWSAYLLAGALTVAAAAWVGGDDAAGVVQPGPRGAVAQPAPKAAARPADAPMPGLALPTARQVQGAIGDPFAVLAPAADHRGAAAAAAIAARAGTARPLTAPPLPFVYLGRWNEDGKTSIFVQRDGRSYKIDGPGPLDAEYAVRSLDGDRVSLDYLPLGISQELRLDAAATAAPAVAAVAPSLQRSPEPDAAEN